MIVWHEICIKLLLWNVRQVIDMFWRLIGGEGKGGHENFIDWKDEWMILGGGKWFVFCQI